MIFAFIWLGIVFVVALLLRIACTSDTAPRAFALFGLLGFVAIFFEALKYV